MNIDPGVVTQIQLTFLQHFNEAFSLATRYAFNLLYLFAAMELVILGFAWMLQRDVGWDKLFFKIIKIGIIFFALDNYPWLLSVILDSFAQLAGTVVNDASVSEYIFNPAKIWEYGYDAGINLLQMASNSNLIGLSMILVTIGMGILLVFGLLGILMITQTIAFYAVSFGALIFLPFGALTSSRNMLDKAVRSVLQSGLRLMILIIIIGIAVIVWKEFDLTDLATTTNFNLNQPLGLFFTALLFLFLAFYLPKVISQAVGDLGGSLFEGGATNITTTNASMSAISNSSGDDVPNVQIASTVAPGASSSSSSSQGAISSVSTAASMPTASTPISGSIDAKLSKDTLSQASTELSKSFSENTVKKIKDGVIRAMKEK